MPKGKIMLSHTTAESYLADTWKELLLSALGLADENVWYSNDPQGPIGGAEGFAEQIVDKLRKANAILSLQTPCSGHKPWLIWEAGIAKGIRRSIHVIVYVPPEFMGEKRAKMLANLGTPLDAFDHKDGTNRTHVDTVLNCLERDLKLQARHDRREAAIDKYLSTLHEYGDCWTNRSVVYDKRILLHFNRLHRKQLAEERVIADDVIVEGQYDALSIFGYGPAPGARTWKQFVAHLESLDMPWRDSATQWARSLIRPLTRALRDLLVEEAEGLPLYLDARPSNRNTYRPSISQRTDRGDTTSFEISFTLVPKELSCRPSGKVGILLHHLDFCRMMRWGVLEERKFRDFFAYPDSVEKSDVSNLLRDFVSRINAIHAEFWNRGLDKDAILGATEDKSPKAHIQELLRRYCSILRFIDSNDHDSIPHDSFGVSALQDAYREMLELNKECYLYAHRALGDELQKLRTKI